MGRRRDHGRGRICFSISGNLEVPCSSLRTCTNCSCLSGTWSPRHTQLQHGLSGSRSPSKDAGILDTCDIPISVPEVMSLQSLPQEPQVPDLHPPHPSLTSASSSFRTQPSCPSSPTQGPQLSQAPQILTLLFFWTDNRLLWTVSGPVPAALVAKEMRNVADRYLMTH